MFIIINFVYQLEVGNIVELLNAGLLTAGTATAFSSYISIDYQRKNTRILFHTLQATFGKTNFLFSSFIRFELKIFFAAEHSSSAEHLYLGTNDMCERNMKWAMIILHATYVLPGVISLVGGSIFDHDGHHIDAQNLHIPLKTR